MMADSEEKIKSEIKEYIAKYGGAYAAWYVGVSGDARDRLFNGHGVDEQTDAWIWLPATSSAAARRVEAYFHEFGAAGDPGAGDEQADQVYAYKKAAHTTP